VQFDATVAALEDKIVQKATVVVLNCIYEEEFLGFSYGFRPKRGAHDALDALVIGISTRRVNFIFDADLASFFDSVSKDWLVRFVEHRIGDKRIIRLIRRRRSQKDRFTWERMARLAGDWLPQPRNFHPWPNVRFAVKHSR